MIHGAELINFKYLVVIAIAFLLEQHRPLAFQLDRNGNREQERREQNQGQPTQNTVFQRLHHDPANPNSLVSAAVNPNAFVDDGSGSIWLGTFGGGINKIDKTINNLLDNITSANREFVDRRLGELQQDKHQLETRLEELDRLSLSQDEINGIVSDSMKFLAGLEFVLREGLPQEKLVALRQCIEKINVDKPSGKITLAIYLVPVGNLQATREHTALI